MEVLQQQYREALVDRSEALERSLQALKTGGRSVKSIESIRQIAHALQGSGGTYGYPEITAAAKTVNEADQPQIEEAVSQLLNVLQTVMRNATS